MRLSINGRVVKSYDVAVSTPRMVECFEGFQQLDHYLTVLRVDEERRKSETLEHPGLVVAPIESESEAEVESESKAEAEAKEKAAMIIAEAEIFSQEIRAQAQTDMDRLRQEVIQKAQAEVYPVAQAEGFQTGYQTGFEAGEAEGQRLIQNANHLLSLAQRAVQEEYAKVDKDLLHLAILIAERIVRSSIALKPHRLVGIIQALTLLPQEREGCRHHLKTWKNPSPPFALRLRN